MEVAAALFATHALVGAGLEVRWLLRIVDSMKDGASRAFRAFLALSCVIASYTIFYMFYIELWRAPWTTRCTFTASFYLLEVLTSEMCSKLYSKCPRAIRNQTQTMTSDLEHYFQRDWLELYFIVELYNWDTARWLKLWKQVQQYVIALYRVRRFITGIAGILMLLAALLSLSRNAFFSEFPNGIPFPCTTMPWTIWPALVVLWGVCWMFYEELAQGGEPFHGGESYHLEDLSAVFSMPSPWGLFDDYRFPGLDAPIPLGGGEGNFTSLYDWPNSDAYLFGTEQEDLRRESTSPRLPVDQTFDKGLLQVQNPAANILGFQALDCIDSTFPVAFSISHSQASGINQSTPRNPAANTFAVEAGTETGTQVETNVLRTAPATKSKHGQAEKYFCTHSDCPRAKLGSGFRRKDHLDQHLRGLHKQSSVPRLRISSAKSLNPPGPKGNERTKEPSVVSRKRSRGYEAETASDNSSQESETISKELAEERQLRKSAEEEVRRLRQKLNNYEERMEKYEERLDRLMSLLEQQQKK